MKLLLLLLALPAAAQAPSEERLKALEARLEKLEGAPAKTGRSAFNPALGVALDMTYRQENDKASGGLRAAELHAESPADPFFKGWIMVNASREGVEAEEAAIQTTALPHGLQLTGGRVFASFGRLGHFHDHELPVIDRPRSLETFVGGETKADGLELSWLTPLPFYLNATLGAYEKIGAENTRRRSGESPLNSFTYLGRLATYADLGDDYSLDLGVSAAWTPRRYVTDTSIAGTDYNNDGTPDGPRSSAGIETRANTWRSLTGADLTLRWQPSAGGLYKGAVWGTEVFQNNERRFDADTNLPTDRVRAYGGYSYVQLKLGRWEPGAMLDLSESLDTAHDLTRTVTAMLNYRVTEFSRLRATYARQDSNVRTQRGAHILGLQWTAVLGNHVHGFRDR